MNAAADAVIPPAVGFLATAIESRAGVAYQAARWTPDGLARLVDHLAGTGAATLGTVADEALLAAWGDTVDRFLDPASAERRALQPALLRLCGLSAAGLDAALAAVLGGVRRPHAEALQERARELTASAAPPALAVLAGNLPALAVQPLLPALLLRRPVLLKSPSAEPLFAPAFVAALVRRLPALGDGIAAITWRGGDAALEAPVLARVGTVLAYGDRAAVDDLAARAPGRVVDYGPKLSLAVVATGADLVATAAGLARDVALFDQRGCLSVQAVLVEGEVVARELAAALAAALSRLADELPPGPLDAVAAAGVQQLRLESAMRGTLLPGTSLGQGTVLLAAPGEPLAPSPGLRTVRVHPVAGLSAVPALLAPWGGWLQGAALVGDGAWALQDELAALGVSRCAPPGELQHPDASWHNGGRDPLAVLAASPGDGGLAG